VAIGQIPAIVIVPLKVLSVTPHRVLVEGDFTGVYDFVGEADKEDSFVGAAGKEYIIVGGSRRSITL